MPAESTYRKVAIPVPITASKAVMIIFAGNVQLCNTSFCLNSLINFQCMKKTDMLMKSSVVMMSAMNAFVMSFSNGW